LLASSVRGPASRPPSTPHRLGLNYANVELGLDVDAHPVLGDQRLISFVRAHRQRQRVHVDRRDVVNDRPDEGAAVDHHLLAQEAGPHEGDLLGRAAIEPLHHPVDDGDHHHRDNQPEDQLPDDLSRHVFLPWRVASYLRCYALECAVCSVSATSVGSRSIEEAP
jgi:hypothetical protein